MKVWIDVDNSPHVLFFGPIIEELRRRGNEVEVTARDYAQTLGLLRLRRIEHTVVGRHDGRHLLLKILGLFRRTGQLVNFARGKGFDVAVSHGSRALPVAALILRIPCATFYDYEHVFMGIFNSLPGKILVPKLIPDEVLEAVGANLDRIVKYPGLKEEVYLRDFLPDPTILREIPLERGKVIATVRPPAKMAHYYSARSGDLYEDVLKYLLGRKDTQAVVLPRTEGERKRLMELYQQDGNLIVPQSAVDGLNLIWHSDLVISGGGTMNREAALLGVPVYSIFQGRPGVLDSHLEREGRLRFIRSSDEISNIELKKRTVPVELPKPRSDLVRFMVEGILTAGNGASGKEGMAWSEQGL